MAIRMSGLISNMDTDSIVKELMSAQSLKKTKIENKITKTEWTQEKWKELNAKIYKLYTGSISKMKTQGAYSTKTVTSSDDSKVTVKANASAVVGSHSVQVNKLASSQYITGAQITSSSGSVTMATKLADVDSGLVPTDNSETSITFKTNNKSVSLSVNTNTTISDFLLAANEAGINASFDAGQGRFFLSSKESGEENYFEITTATVTGDELSAKNALRNSVNYSSMNSTDQAQFDMASDLYRTYTEELINTSLSDTDRKVIQNKLDAAGDTINSYVLAKVTKDLEDKYKAGTADLTGYDVKSLQTVKDEAEKAYKDSLGEGEDINDEKHQAALKSAQNAAVAKVAAKYAAAVKKEFTDVAPAGNPYTTGTIDTAGKLTSYAGTTPAAFDNPKDSTKLNGLGISNIARKTMDGKLTYLTNNPNMTVVEASNSEIEYNGAKIENSSNAVTVNGLTFELHGVTQGTTTPSISLSVAKDTQGTYDVIKEFITQYNDVLKEMNTLYNAESSRGYDPLTDDEREAMTDDQIEKWETKIKNSLLRRDGTLSTIISSMKNNMMGSISYEGKSYSLATFGIGTTDYFEKGLLHIDGDEADSATSMNADKLKAALEEDPDAVMTTLSGLVSNLYIDLTDKMKSTTLSSALTLYNDKQLTKTLKEYKSELSTMEDRLQTLEDRYYSQFTAMEKALATLNSQQSSLSSMLGG